VVLNPLGKTLRQKFRDARKITTGREGKLKSLKEKEITELSGHRIQKEKERANMAVTRHMLKRGGSAKKQKKQNGHHPEG